MPAADCRQRAKSSWSLTISHGPRDRVANLKSLGYQVLEADCAKAALDMLATGVKIDLLFTDIVMPGGTQKESRPEGRLL